MEIGMTSKKLSPLFFLKKTQRRAVEALFEQANAFLVGAEKNDAFVMQVAVGTRATPSIISLLIVLNTGERGLTVLRHKSPPRMLREIASWLNALKPGLDWRESISDRIEDMSIELAKVLGIEPESLLFTIEVGKKVRIKEIVREDGAFFIRFV
jgi:hypothetical protein